MKELIFAIILVVFARCGDKSVLIDERTKRKSEIEVISKDSAGNDLLAKDAKLLALRMTDLNSLSISQLKLSIFYTRAYCNGAAPTEDILMELASKKKLSLSEIKLVNKSNGKEYLAVTDKRGEIMINIPNGDYDLFLTEKINFEIPTGFNTKCAISLNKVRKSFILNGPKIEKEVIHFECDPCHSMNKRRP
jgi:hypothetical protein